MTFNGSLILTKQDDGTYLGVVDYFETMLNTTDEEVRDDIRKLFQYTDVVYVKMSTTKHPEKCEHGMNTVSECTDCAPDMKVVTHTEYRSSVLDVSPGRELRGYTNNYRAGLNANRFGDYDEIHYDEIEFTIPNSQVMMALTMANDFKRGFRCSVQ